MKEFLFILVFIFKPLSAQENLNQELASQPLEIVLNSLQKQFDARFSYASKSIENELQSGKFSNDSILGKLHNIFSSHAGDNPEELEAQLESLQNGVDIMLVEAQRRAKMNADRVAQAAEGEHKVERARKKISRLINKDTSGKTLPAIVMEWLEQGWTPLLTLTYLRETSESKRFRGAVKLYRQVLSLFNPTNAGRQELFDRFKPLINLMHNELDQLNGILPDHNRWHEGIISVAEQHLKTGEIEQVIEVPEQVEEEKPVLEGKGARKALNLQVGDWLLLVEQDQNVSVVWVAEDGSKFACVNHSGMKVIDFTLEKSSQNSNSLTHS